MGRWTQYDEDDYRLPEGMKRVGYDADTGKYYFRDQSGKMYEGAEGVQFGRMKRVSNAPIALGEAIDADVEAAPRHADGYAPLATDPNARPFTPTSPYRALFPFFLIILTVLLLVWRLVVVPAHHTTSPPTTQPCPSGTDAYSVRRGDTCWQIAHGHGIRLQDLLDANPKMVCDPLQIGTIMCVPTKEEKEEPARKRKVKATKQ